ncbi:1539_t:CDS:1, partial [Gigaspora rosea]
TIISESFEDFSISESPTIESEINEVSKTTLMNLRKKQSTTLKQL